MRVYEELFIVKPDAPEEEVEAYIGQVKDLITNGNGSVDKLDNWGVRKLAYRIAKYSEGRYVLVQFSSSPELVKEIERRMRVTDLVIKFITVRVDQKMRKIEKRKKHREKRAARRPAPPVAAPAVPAEAAAAAPGLPGAAPAASHPAPGHASPAPSAAPAPGHAPGAPTPEPAAETKE